MSVTDPLASAPLEIRSLIRGVADHLRKEFEGIFAAETIQRYMAESYDPLSGAREKGFVPPHAARLTLEQHVAELRFQTLQAHAQRRLRQRQQRGSPCRARCAGRSSP